MTSRTTFGQKLRDLRKAKALSQRDLAERVSARLKADDGRGFDFTYLSKIENDRSSPPSIAAITQLAIELDADINELITLAGKAPPELEETLLKSEPARMFFRSAFDTEMTDEDWSSLSKALKKRRET